MDQKTPTLTTNRSAPSHRYYRSVRYKVNTTSLSGQRTDLTLSAQRDKTVFRKVITRAHHSHHTQLVSDQSISKADHEKIDQKMEVQVKKPYLQTWYKLLHSQPEGQKELQIKIPRVYLPHISENQHSMFTTLDPLPLSYQYIQEGIEQLRSQIPRPKKEMSQIRADMKIIESKVRKQLGQIEEIASKGFAKLKRILRGYKVQYQQSTMRFRRMCVQLQEKDKDLKSSFEETKPRLDVLQDQIFSSKPFDLQSNQFYEQQFPQKYF